MTINGRVVAISRVNVKDSTVVADQLRDAKGTTTQSPPGTVVDQVALHGIEIDDTIISALVDLLSSKRHQKLNNNSVSSSPTVCEWDSLRFVNCTGDVGKVVSACTQLGSDDEPIIIKNVEIDLQLVDELHDMLFLRQMLLSSGTSTVESLRLSTSLRPENAKFIADGLESTNILTSLDLRPIF